MPITFLNCIITNTAQIAQVRLQATQEKKQWQLPHHHHHQLKEQQQPQQVIQ